MGHDTTLGIGIANIINVATIKDRSHVIVQALVNEIGDHISRDRIVSLTDAVLAIVMTLSIGDCCAGDISFRSCN
jgi:hypothetical protein